MKKKDINILIINTDIINKVMYRLSIFLFLVDNLICSLFLLYLLCNFRNAFMTTLDEHTFENKANAIMMVMNADPFAFGELKISFDKIIEYMKFVKYNINMANKDVFVVYKYLNDTINIAKILT